MSRYLATSNVDTGSFKVFKNQHITQEQYDALPDKLKGNFKLGKPPVDPANRNAPIGETPEEKAAREGAVKLAHSNKILSAELDNIRTELRRTQDDLTLFTEDNKKLSDENKQLAEQVKALQEDLAAANKEVEKLSKKAK
jgi:uncharacterized protein (DUF3084 family)